MQPADATDVVDRLFAAENRRDWEVFRALLHPQVEWTIIGPTDAVIRGRDAYMQRIEAVYAAAPAARFTVRRSLNNFAGLVVTELMDNAGDISVDVFYVRDGVVVREWSSCSVTPAGDAVVAQHCRASARRSQACAAALPTCRLPIRFGMTASARTHPPELVMAGSVCGNGSSWPG